MLGSENINLTIEEIEQLLENEQHYRDDPVLDKYYRIADNNDGLFNNPIIGQAINRYQEDKTDYLGHLDFYSDEQFKYVTYPRKENIKVIACAGSGKTRSIIGRIKYMVQHNLVRAENIYMITFTKDAAADFRARMETTHPDHESFCKLTNFTTIDAMAKAILSRVKSHKSANVEILSIALRNYLLSADEAQIAAIKVARPMDHLFVDEAQDLNQVQYDIICLLQRYFGTTIELIGDPNQNIYQFRNSESKFLMDYEGKNFELTLNWRSTDEIINFTEYLKPIKTSRSKSATGKTGKLVKIINTAPHLLHARLIGFLERYKKTGDLMNVAIICPTKGTGARSDTGLSVFFNLLHLKKIPFVQFYDETGTLNGKKQLVRQSGHVNLLTWHGTKGLEFDTVFVMDCYQNVFNIPPNQEEHANHRFLLYVASSRAMNQMIICVSNRTHSGFMNHWLKSVPAVHYETEKAIRVPNLEYRTDEIKTPIRFIKTIIGKMEDKDLDYAHSTIKIKSSATERVYPDFHELITKDNNLFEIFAKELLYWQWILSDPEQKRQVRTYKLIERIIKSQFVVLQDQQMVDIVRKYVTDNLHTWDSYDAMRKEFPKDIRRIVAKQFDRSVPPCDHLVVTNDFVKIIERNKQVIIDSYDMYLEPSTYEYDYNTAIDELFYLIVVQYAYNNNHYYYVEDKGELKYHLISDSHELFHHMNEFVHSHLKNHELQIGVPVEYLKLQLTGEIDHIQMIETDECLTLVVCANEIAIRHYLELFVLNFCHQLKRKTVNKIYVNDYRIINVLSGQICDFRLTVNAAATFNIINSIARAGGLIFQNLNLVYDLETTGLIELKRKVGSITPPRTGPVIYTTDPNEKAPVTETGQPVKKKAVPMLPHYPEIIEIAIKDYESEMIIINSLIKPSKKICEKVIEVTGITNEDLEDAFTLAEIKTVIETKFKTIASCKLIAHNGMNFDDKIIKYDKVIPKIDISYLDTLMLIPMHVPDGLKLESKKLGAIYQTLLKSEFPAHRAMNDVKALITVMKHLNIVI